MRGAWGTGKTHLLCDIASARLKQGLPTLLILAQTLRAGADPLQELLGQLAPDVEVRTVLQDLDRLGQLSGGRALILVDAINEGDRIAWNQYIERAASLVGNFRNVGLVLSCRTPFDRQILTNAAKQAYVFASHVGFTEIEFDAQTEFFRYYNIPHPHIPLLAPEFSTPLFLKILCTSIERLSQSAKKKRISSFASGHKGMTKLLEDFVVEVGVNAEADFHLPSKTCWRLLKGSGDTAKPVGIAPKMADLMEDQIPLPDAIEIVSQVTGLGAEKSAELMTRLVTDGLLLEDGRLESGKWLGTIRLPYQRFSDHLISRHLLARHLDTKSAATIRKSLLPGSPLGQIFVTAKWGGYEMPGLVSAIMLEFPERVKRVLHADRQELAFYLPTKMRTYDLSEPFIEGLLWRNVDSFSKQTDRLIDIFLKADAIQTREAILEALVSLASRPDHRYNAKKLHNYLKHMSLPDRDLFWSEFVRSRHASSAVFRVLDWVQQPDRSNMEEAVVENLIILTSLLLTSTVRPLRDRATHCLVLLGECSPKILFVQVGLSLSFNDPYVPERMMAAAYGVLMRLWARPAPALREAALPLALKIRDWLIGSTNRAPIEHILMRDYAQGFIGLTARLVPDRAGFLLKDRRHVSPKTVLRLPSRISLKSVEPAARAIHMDFGNYTIGRLVADRSNYDESHVGYRRVRRQIERRIVDLGYDAAKFQEVDRFIGDNGFRAGRSSDGQKTDRYGKKYSWIAYYEVAGRLSLCGKLPDRWEARLSDADIDPSFPASPLRWQPSLRELFSKPFLNVAEWLQMGASPQYEEMLVSDAVDGRKGPWVLLEGSISEAAESDHRRAFTFLRGILVSPENLARFQTMALRTEYPGNRAIPEPIEEHYLFAGEIGWSDKYGHRREGGLVPDMEQAFEGNDTKKVTKRFGDLSVFEKVELTGGLKIVFASEDSSQKAVEYGDDDIVTINEYLRIPGVMIEVPVRRFAWESYHSVENQSGSALYPAPFIVRSLSLRKFGAQIDMLDRHGDLATTYRKNRSEGDGSNSQLLYIRADLLEEYLKRREMVLVWINWGEREMDYRVAEGLRDVPEVRKVWGAHEHIHRQLFVYDPIKRSAEVRSIGDRS